MALSSCVLGKLRNTKRFVPAAEAAFSIINHSSTTPPKLIDIDDVEHRRYRPRDIIRFSKEPKSHARLMDMGKIRDVASFAVKEFNHRKNAQLQLVRAVKGFRKSCKDINYIATFYYFITLEALDDHVVAAADKEEDEEEEEEPKTYQAMVSQSSRHPENLELALFVLADENGHGSFSFLYDSRIFWSYPPWRSGFLDDRGYCTRVGGVKMDVPIKTDDNMTFRV